MATNRQKNKSGAFPDEEERSCAMPGCAASGTYRAPLTPPGETPPAEGPRWQYLCLEHVRAFNAGWNWFEGMTQEEIFRVQTPYPQWESATQTFAHNSHVGGHIGGNVDRMAEALSSFYWSMERRESRKPAAGLPEKDRQALAKLGLGGDATLADVRHAYRCLARRYHPDLNNGNRVHEARLQALTEAYDWLRKSNSFRLFSEGRGPAAATAAQGV